MSSLPPCALAKDLPKMAALPGGCEPLRLTAQLPNWPTQCSYPPSSGHLDISFWPPTGRYLQLFYFLKKTIRYFQAHLKLILLNYIDKPRSNITFLVLWYQLGSCSCPYSCNGNISMCHRSGSSQSILLIWSVFHVWSPLHASWCWKHLFLSLFIYLPSPLPPTFPCLPPSLCFSLSFLSSLLLSWPKDHW